jgi:glycosyltransferase involved in cell wall biosynthesis
LKILFAADVSISSLIGGAERVLHEQCVRLAQRGHEVHIITRKLPGHKETQKKISGVFEWRYENNYNNPFNFLLSTIKNGKLLFEKLHNQYHFDCINFHQPFTSFAVLQSSLSKNIAKIYTCHSLSFEEFISRNNHKKKILSRSHNYLQVFMRKWIERKALSQSDKIIVLSRFTREKLEDIYKIHKEKITIIPGGVDLNRFKLSKNGILKEEKLSIPGDKIIMLTVRNLVNRMGLEDLIFAFKKVVNSAPDMYLIIGGDGPLKNDLLGLTNSLGLKEYIHFTGFIPEDQLPSYYQMADLFVLPTKELEGFGLVTVEALASGLPVLGTPIGGTKEILDRFNPDFIFEDAGVESIFKKILEKYKIIKENPKKWQEISQQCRNFAVTNYSWEFNVDCLEKMLLGFFEN